jgi:hypothetical protein
MEEIEIVKICKLTNKAVAKKTMTIAQWKAFNKINKTHYYIAYEIGFSSFVIE